MADRETVTANSEDQPIWVQDLIAWLEKIKGLNLTGSEWVVREVLAELPGQGLPEEFWSKEEVSSEGEKSVQEEVRVELSPLSDEDRVRIQQEMDAAEAQLDRPRAFFAVVARLTASEPQLLQQALNTAQMLQHEYCRSLALTAVAAQFPSEERKPILQQALDTAQIILEGSRSTALTKVIAQFSASEPQLLQQVLESTQVIPYEEMRSEVFAAVAAKLPYSGRDSLFQKMISWEFTNSWFSRILLDNIHSSKSNLRQKVIDKELSACSSDTRRKLEFLSYIAQKYHPSQCGDILKQIIEIIEIYPSQNPYGEGLYFKDFLSVIPPFELELEIFEDLLIRCDDSLFIAVILAHLSPKTEWLIRALNAAKKYIVNHRKSYKNNQVEIIAAITKKISLLESEELLEKALEVVLSIESSSDRFSDRLRLLALVVSYIPPTKPKLLKKALKAAAPYDFNHHKAIALGAIAAKLPPSKRQRVLKQALKLASTIKNPIYKTFALVSVAAQLPSPQSQFVFQQGLELAFFVYKEIKLRASSSMDNPVYLLQSAIAEIPCSETQILKQALRITSSIQDENDRSEILEEIGAKIPIFETQLLQEFLNSMLFINNESRKVKILKVVCDKSCNFSTQIQQKIIQIALELKSVENRINVLTTIAFQSTEFLILCCPPTLLSSVLEIVPRGESSADRAKLLSALAPRLSAGLFPRVLQLIQTKITHPAYQAEVLGNLAPYLPAERLSEALDIVQNYLPGYSYPATALCNLIPYLSPEQLKKALEIAEIRCPYPELLAQILHQVAIRVSIPTFIETEPSDSNLKDELIDHILDQTDQHLSAERTITNVLTVLVPSLDSDDRLKFIKDNLLPKLKSEFYLSQVLAALATSPHLTPEQLSPFYQQAKALCQDRPRPKATALSAFIPLYPELHVHDSIIAQFKDQTNSIQKTDIAIILATRPQPKELSPVDNDQLVTDQFRALQLIREMSQTHEAKKANSLVKLAPHLLPQHILEAQSIALELQDRYHQVRALLAIAIYFPEIRLEVQRQIEKVKIYSPYQMDEYRLFQPDDPFIIPQPNLEQYLVPYIELLSQFATIVPEQIPTLLKAVKEWADQNQFKEDPKEPDPNTYKRRRILIALKPNLPIRLVREIDREASIGKAPQDLWERSLFVLRNEYRQALKTGSLRNDATQDEDLLNLKDEINALTEMLLMRDLEPPVAVGILGGWGGGKSYIMHLMQSHMVEIRSQGMEAIEAWGLKDADSKSPDGDRVGRFVGHIYQIKFDAWTYAKANLWASLMQEIFYELNRQISLEQKLGHILSNFDRSSDRETVPDNASSKQRSDRYLDQFIYNPLLTIRKKIRKNRQDFYKYCEKINKKFTDFFQNFLNLVIVQFILHIIVFALFSLEFLIKVIIALIILAKRIVLFWMIEKNNDYFYHKIIRPALNLFDSLLYRLKNRKIIRLSLNLFASFLCKLKDGELLFEALFSSQIKNYYFQDYSLNHSGSNAPYNSVIENILNRIVFLMFVGFQKRLSDRQRYWNTISMESDYKPVTTEDLISPDSSSNISSKAFSKALREGGKLWQALYLMDEEERTAFLQSNLKPSQFKDWKESASKTEISNSLWDLLDRVKREEKQIFKQKEQILETKEKELQRQRKKAEEDVNQRLAQRSVTAFWKPIINAVAKLHFSDEKIKEFTEAGKTYTMLRQAITSWQGLLALFTMTLLIVLTLDPATQALLGKFGIADWFNQLIQNILIWFESLPQWIKEIPKEVPSAIQILAAITASVTALLPILKSLANYITSVQKEQAEIQSKREVLLKQEQNKVAGLIQEVASLKLLVEEQRREVGLTADYSSLIDFVNSRLKDGDYSKHLGLMHQFKDDLWKLSSSLLPPTNATEFKTKLDKLKQIFPRGPARVVVYIDDLDRCPPNTVVEVLEAV